MQEDLSTRGGATSKTTGMFWVVFCPGMGTRFAGTVRGSTSSSVLYSDMSDSSEIVVFVVVLKIEIFPSSCTILDEKQFSLFMYASVSDIFNCVCSEIVPSFQGLRTDF